MKRLAVIGVLVFALLGCYSGHHGSSQRISDEKILAQIKPGTTTQRQVLDYFGQPRTRTVINDGEQEWYYMNYHVPAAYDVPVFSAVYYVAVDAGKDDPFESNALTVRFNKDGTVKEYQRQVRNADAANQR